MKIALIALGSLFLGAILATAFVTSRREAFALLDLAQVGRPDDHAGFVETIGRIATEHGGRVTVANRAIAPMIVPGEESGASDDGIDLLVISEYPTKQTLEAALARREAPDVELPARAVRTYEMRPVRGIESLFGRSLPYTLGLLRHEPVPTIAGTQERDALVRRALILGEQPDEARWVRLIERAGDDPIWMLNFLEYRDTASYAEDSGGAAPTTPISGARAYRQYGQGMIGSLAAVGGRVAWSGFWRRQIAGPDDGRWHQVAIAHYPSPAAMMTMLAMEDYQAAHVHRTAALTRTRLLATQPVK